MPTVRRITTLIERVEIPDDDELGFDARAAVAVSRLQAPEKWTVEHETVVYEAHSDDPAGCVVSQLTVRNRGEKGR